MMLTAAFLGSFLPIFGFLNFSEAVKIHNLGESPLVAHSEGPRLSEAIGAAPKTTLAWIQEAVATEVADQLKSQIDSRLKQGSSSQSETENVATTVGPAVRALMKTALGAIGPEIQEECQRLTEQLKATEEEEESEVELSMLEAKAKQEGFWDKLKEAGKGFAGGSSPLMESLMRKLSELIRKFGEKVIPTLHEDITRVVHAACLKGENDAGFESED